MLNQTRVSTAIDVNRIGEALARPGMDTRIWVALAIVKSVFVDAAEGIFADVVIMPSGDEETARVGSEYAGSGFGTHWPIQVDDEVLVAAPSGNPDEGIVIVNRLYSASDPPPPEAVSNPQDVVIHIKAGQKISIVVENGGTVELGGAGLGSAQGVVQGEGVDSFTGLTYEQLGNSSAIVKAVK